MGLTARVPAMRWLYETEQWMAVPLERVFAFFSDPWNLPLISPPGQGSRIAELRIVPPSGIPDAPARERFAGPGSMISVSFRIFPYLPLRGRATAEIVEYEWLRYFRDIGRASLLRWDHRHEFSAAERNGRSGTLLRDRFRYNVVVSGSLLNEIFVRRQIAAMFEHRHRATSQILGKPASGSC